MSPRNAARTTMAFVSALGCAAVTAGPDSGTASRIETVVRSYAEAGHFSGCVLVARGDEVLFEGERFGYSSFGYDLLAYACERLEGRPFAEVLRERVFVPAGMSRTSLADFRSIASRHLRAAGRGKPGTRAARTGSGATSRSPRGTGAWSCS